MRRYLSDEIISVLGNDQGYRCNSRAYLSRADELIRKGDPASLFYAAFELRCGIEARMNEYLAPWQDVRRKTKSGWRMAELHGRIEKQFRLGRRYARWAVHDERTGELLVSFYYTPVTPRLRKLGEQLGNYLHFMKEFRASGEPWWAAFRDMLAASLEELRNATTGVLLGPVMLGPDGETGKMYLDLPRSVDREELSRKFGFGAEAILTKVTYPEALPMTFEPQAVTWWAVEHRDVGTSPMPEAKK